MAASGQDIIVIGGSAGAIEALMKLVAGLPSDLPAAVFIVVHTAPNNPGILPRILERAGTLPAVMARDRQPIERGRIYIAPPDHHLLIKNAHMITPRGPQENGFRPAVDPLFRTAAVVYGPRVAGVVLSGGMDDGTYGLMVIKEHGGIAIAQHPDDALVNSMPLAAIQNVELDHVLPASEISATLVKLAAAAASREDDNMASDREAKTDVAEGLSDALEHGGYSKPPSIYTCPECGGSLWEFEEGNLLRFRCHVGHGYTADALLADQAAKLESSLWAGLRALEEAAALRRRMAKRMSQGRLDALAKRFNEQAEAAEAQADQVRQLLNGRVADINVEQGKRAPDTAAGGSA